MRFRENDFINATYQQVLAEQKTLKEDLGDPHDVDLSNTPLYQQGGPEVKKAPPFDHSEFGKFKMAVIDYMTEVYDEMFHNDESTAEWHGKFNEAVIKADSVTDIVNAICTLLYGDDREAIENAWGSILDATCKFNIRRYI